ncbi:MAG: N-formylglutamate amidohydrolase [Halioglobus sp.]
MYPETILPIVAHIPHAGTAIPSAVLHQFIADSQALWNEVLRLTDWYTDELFSIPGIAKSQTPISRLVLDLERYCEDDLEENAQFGQGVIYTHNTLGERIRHAPSPVERQFLLDTYYRPWHLKLETNLEQQLQRWGYCLLLDCHSFPDEPFFHENDNGRARPDICLGTSINTPSWLLYACYSFFLNRGYTVKVNSPYAGCLVPGRFEGNIRVPAIMIEINRRLYLKPVQPISTGPNSPPKKSAKFETIKNDIWAAMLSLALEASHSLETSPPFSKDHA